VWSLVLGAPAGEVEALAEAVCPPAAVGLTAEVEGHQIEQLGQPCAVGERADAVADSAVDFAKDLLGGAGRADAVRVTGRDLGLGDATVGVKPADSECSTLACSSRIASSSVLQTPEGVITACAVRVLGGCMEARLAPQLADEKRALLDAGLSMERVYSVEDLVSGDAFFAATDVTGSELLRRPWRSEESTFAHSVVVAPGLDEKGDRGDGGAAMSTDREALEETAREMVADGKASLRRTRATQPCRSVWSRWT